MKKLLLSLFFLLAALGLNVTAQPVTLKSPDGQMQLAFELRDGVPYYSLDRAGQPVVLPSKMGFTLEWRDDLAHAFILKDQQYSTFDETWEPVWGEEAHIRNHYNELLVTLEQPIGSVESMDGSTQTKATVMQIRFRLYDDGLGFRYEFPEQPGLIDFVITKELTEFAMAGDHTAFWIPGDYDTQEYSYNVCKMSEIPSVAAKMTTGNASQQVFSPSGVQTALQLKTDDGLYINIHEAAVVNYPTSNLELDVPSRTFRTQSARKSLARRTFSSAPLMRQTV